jgi:hypothetical protein
MTVSQLIEKLKEFPADAPVLISEIEDFSIADPGIEKVYCLDGRYYYNDPGYNERFIPGGIVVDAIILN